MWAERESLWKVVHALKEVWVPLNLSPDYPFQPSLQAAHNALAHSWAEGTLNVAAVLATWCRPRMRRHGHVKPQCPRRLWQPAWPGRRSCGWGPSCSTWGLGTERRAGACGETPEQVSSTPSPALAWIRNPC